jgi:hypothetical protein
MARPLAFRIVILGVSSATCFQACTGGTGNAPGTGGTAATTGGTAATTGGTAATTGGTAATTGGTAAIMGGTAATTGGTAATTGGTAATTGGASSATGGSSTVGGTAATTGGTGVASGGAAPTTGGSNNNGGVAGAATPAYGGAPPATGGSAGSSGNASSGVGNGGTAGAASGGNSAAGSPAAGLSKGGEVKLTGAGLTIVSYGGYLNGESFQQEGILSYNGYQYAAFWNTARHVVMARRALPSGAWSTFEFSDYTNNESDAHNTISLGICPGDGTLHVSFDHHVSNLHYRKSVSNLVTAPATATWAASSFGAVSGSLVGSTAITMLTYPRFVTEPGGNKLLFGARLGNSGAGDEYLWEYDATSRAWTSLGKYLDGIVDNINGYPHGLSYTKGGTRLHVSWCWRATSDATTNYDLLYAYSDDNGRTWKNNAGTSVASTGSSFLRSNTAGIQVWAIKQNRGLINQEHMAVDATGRVHVLLSHMPDSQADDSNFDSARSKAQFFDYWRNNAGTWTRVPIGLSVIANLRGKFAISTANNVYAILPDLRIVGASPSNNFSTWAPLVTDSGRFFSDPLIDAARLVSEDKLTVFYPEKSSPNIWILDYTLR